MITREYTFYPELASFTNMDFEMQLVVEYYYTPAEPQTWESPGYDAEIEIERFTAGREHILDQAVAEFYNDQIHGDMDFDHLKEAILSDNHS